MLTITTTFFLPFSISDLFNRITHGKLLALVKLFHHVEIIRALS